MGKVAEVKGRLRRARERELARALALDSDDPKVARHTARLARERQQRRERRRARDRSAAGHEEWLAGASTALYAALDDRRRAPGPVTQAAFVAALQALVADAAGARFVAQCLELNPAEVERLVGPLDVS